MILSASAISTTVKKVSLTTVGIASAIALGAGGASAVTLINTTVGIEAGNTVEGTFNASDTIVLNASGTIDNFAPFDTYITNAAGVSTDESTIGAGSIRISSSLFNIGSLLIGNNTIGFRQVFASNAANGGGSATPPESLDRTATLADIFGAGFTTTEFLQFIVEPYNLGESIVDTNRISTGGSFASPNNVYTLTGSISQASATDVSEPFTIVGTLIGGTAALRMRKKLKANSN